MVRRCFPVPGPVRLTAVPALFHLSRRNRVVLLNFNGHARAA